MAPRRTPTVPLVARVDLARLDPQRAPSRRALFIGAWDGAASASGGIGLWTGSALGLSLVGESVRASGAAAPFLALAVGAGVRAGLPTAARTAICAVSPLTGLYAEAHVGSDLALRLAGLADALAIAGRTRARGALLWIGPGPSLALFEWPELAGRDPRSTADAIRERLGACATLALGLAGERGIGCALLAAGAEFPSYAGRGGLGAALARTGLKAIAIGLDPVEPVAPSRARDRELLDWLRDSPRLLARSRGGTLELFHRDGAARASIAAEPELGLALAREAEALGSTRHGCKGCPTPCGWVFDRTGHGDRAGNQRAAGAGQRAHFGAAQALGPALGLSRLEDALVLLETCDRLGIDARETGAVLDLWSRACELGRTGVPSPRGDRERLRASIEDLVHGRGALASLPAGAAPAARALGLAGDLIEAKGQAARDEGDLASLLGQCVSTGGSDPMRSFPFLAQSGGDPSRRAARALGLELPSEAFDPRSPVGKGKLVWWHESFAAALDASGFCAFSAAALLSDGVCRLDELAARIEPPALADLPATRPDWTALAPGERLIAAGASIVLARRALNARLGAAADQDRPAWARAALDHPEMLAAYRRCRGIDETGAPTERALASIGSAALARPLDDPATGSSVSSVAPAAPVAAAAARGADVARRAGSISLRAIGPIGACLGRDARLELVLPASARDVLRAAAGAWPAAERLLVRGGEPVPAVLRGGRRVAPDDLCRDGDVLDLVLAISGGAR